MVIIILITLFIGLILANRVHNNLDEFWPFLIATTILTSGLVVLSISYLDEILVYFIIIVSFFSIPVQNKSLRNKLINSNYGKTQLFHVFIYNVTIIYMLIQSIRGILISGRIEQGRWVVYFFMMGIISSVISKNFFPFPSLNKISRIITWSGFFYFSSYLLVGILSPLIIGLDRWELQNQIFGGTTYATFTSVIVFPSIIYLLLNDKFTNKGICWSTLLVVFISSFYYDSRVLLLASSLFIVLSLKKIKLQRILGILIISSSVLAFSLAYISPSYYTPETYFGLITEPFFFFIHPENSEIKSDLGRTEHIKIAFKAISNDYLTLLIGHGLRTSGSIIGPYIGQAFLRYGMGEKANQFFFNDTIGTNTYTAFMVETGIIGTFLIFTNYLCVFIKLRAHKKGTYRRALFWSLILSIFWSMLTNVFDIVLFFLLIMPQGIYFQLSQITEETDNS